MLRRLAGNVVLYLCGVAVVLRFTVRDAVPWLAPLYYATPLPVIAAALLVAAGLLYGRAGPRLVGSLAVLAVCVGLAGLTVPIGRHHCDRPADSLRVFTWNMGWGGGGWQAEVDQVAGVNADLILLVEAGDPGSVMQKMWRQTFPDRSIEFAGGGLVLIARGRLDDVGLHEIAGDTRVATAVATMNGRRWYIVLVDVSSNPFFARGPMLAEVNHIARARTDLPVIVTGDFNTPTGSVWLKPFESSFTHAFASAGRGLAGTWPAPVPLLALDHLWVSPGVRVACARHRWTLLSDHLQLLTNLVVPSVANAQGAAASSSAQILRAGSSGARMDDLQTRDGTSVQSMCGTRDGADGLRKFLIVVSLAGALLCLVAGAYLARRCSYALRTRRWPPPGTRPARDGRVLAGAAATRMAVLGMVVAALLVIAGLVLPLSIWRVLALLAPVA